MAARPREFDTDTVLEAAMKAFWNRGYEATSMADLMEVTGLQKGSLYKAFGDKHALFMATLKRYMETILDEMRAVAAQHEHPVKQLEKIMEHMIHKALHTDGCNGCYAVNVLAERSSYDEQAAAMLEQEKMNMANVFVPIFAQGQAMGAFRADEPAEKLFYFYVTFMAGLATLSKSAMSEEECFMLRDLFLKMIQPQPGGGAG